MNTKDKENGRITETKELVKGVSDTNEIMENEYILKFSKPYLFEGKEYDHVDLSGLESLTISDMIAAENRVKRGAIDKSANLMIELTLEYACYLAARASDLPIEFFFGIPAGASMELKGIVRNFLL